MKSRLIILITVLVMVSGCSTTPKSNVVSANAAKALTLIDTQNAESNTSNIEDALKETLDFCAPILQGFEDKTNSQAKKAYWLSISGLVAGTVIAPALIAANAAANAATSAALSGWAGSTNFASENLKTSGLSGTATAETRKSIITDLTESIEIATDSTKTFDERKSAVLKARSSCVVYDIAVPSISTSGAN